jgi:hypothetical protein
MNMAGLWMGMMGRPALPEAVGQKGRCSQVSNTQDQRQVANSPRHQGRKVVSSTMQRGKNGCRIREVMTFALCVGTVAGLWESRACDSLAECHKLLALLYRTVRVSS